MSIILILSLRWQGDITIFGKREEEGKHDRISAAHRCGAEEGNASDHSCAKDV
jgi:hypothetical protein